MTNKKRFKVLLTIGTHSVMTYVIADMFSVRDGTLFFGERGYKGVRVVNAIAAGSWSNVEEVAQDDN